MEDHAALPAALTRPGGHGDAWPPELEQAIARAQAAERRAVVVTAQLDVLTAVIRLLLDGEHGEAAELIRSALDSAPAQGQEPNAASRSRTAGSP